MKFALKLVLIAAACVACASSSRADLRADIDAALAHVGKLKMMDNGPQYTLAAGGRPLTGVSDDFLRRRSSAEILRSGLSSGCGDYAAAFDGLMREKGAKTMFVDGVELSVESLIHRFSGHTGIAVQDPATGRWILTDPTNGKVVAENWDPAAKIYENRYWIWYVGPSSKYPAKSPEELKAAYDRALRSVPASVWSDNIIGLDFSMGPSMRAADGSWINPRADAFLKKWSGIYDQYGLHPRRRAHIEFAAKSLAPDSADCRRTDADRWTCYVTPEQGMGESWFTWIDEYVAAHSADKWTPSRKLTPATQASAGAPLATGGPVLTVDRSMRRADGTTTNPHADAFVKTHAAKAGVPVLLTDGGPGSASSCEPGDSGWVCRVGQNSGMSEGFYKYILRRISVTQ